MEYKAAIARGAVGVLLFPVLAYLELRDRLENTPWKMK